MRKFAPPPPGRPAADLPARVVHAVELGPVRHLLGAELTKPLTKTELRAILARLA
ncbi:MAG TPA: hypothetical protein VMS17_26705 [Gemmataceae bacterium]|nr:hypothetical protein [Gemmataceae bacterium]